MLPSPNQRCPRLEIGLRREEWLERPTGLPSPCPTPQGLMRATEAKGGHRERRLAAPDRRSRILRSRCGRWSQTPGGGQGARGERGGKRSWRLPQGSRSAEKPGPRTRSAAGLAGSSREMRPRLELGLNASLHSAKSGLPGARPEPLALTRRGPAASSPIRKARDPGLGTLSSQERAPGGHPAPASRRDRRNLLGSHSAPPPHSRPAQVHGDPQLWGALTDPDDVGHPA